MTNKSLQEIDEQFDKEFPIKHYSCEDCWYSCPKSTDGCCNESQGSECNCGAAEENEEHKAFIHKVIAERDEALRKEINSKGILIQGIKEIDGKLYVRIDREDFNGDSVALFDSSILSLLTKE